MGSFRNGGARLERQPTVDHHPVAGAKAFVDEPVVPVPFPDRYRAVLGLPLLAHHPDKMPLRPLLYRPLGYDDAVGPDGALQAGMDVLVRAQQPLGVVDIDPKEKSPGLGIVGGSREG